jgi:hypothetical protein
VCWNVTGLGDGALPRTDIGGGSTRARLLSGSSCEELECFRDGSEAQGCDVRLEWGEGEDLADERLGAGLKVFSGVGTNGME